MFHPRLRYIHIQPFSVVVCLNPISDTSTFSLCLLPSVSPPSSSKQHLFSLLSPVSTTSPTHPYSSFLCRLPFHTHIHITIQPLSVAFCFTPISVKATLILSVVACVNPISDTSSSLRRLPCHTHLRHIQIGPLSVFFRFTPNYDISTLILYLTSSVSPPSQQHPHSSSLLRLLFHPQLQHIHIDSISYMSHHQLRQINIHPLCCRLCQTHRRHIHSRPVSIAFCLAPISATSTFILSLSPSVSPPTPTHP